jgi:hypothetical protein
MIITIRAFCGRLGRLAVRRAEGMQPRMTVMEIAA